MRISCVTAFSLLFSRLSIWLIVINFYELAHWCEGLFIGGGLLLLGGGDWLQVVVKFEGWVVGVCASVCSICGAGVVVTLILAAIIESVCFL